MANVLVEEQYLQDIADSIRDKNGSSDTYTPAQMSGAIMLISGGGGGEFDTPEVDQNTLIFSSTYMQLNMQQSDLHFLHKTLTIS